MAEGTKSMQLNLPLTKKDPLFYLLIAPSFSPSCFFFISSLLSIVFFLCFLLAAFLSLCNSFAYIFSISLISLFYLSSVSSPLGLDPRFSLLFSLYPF